VATSLVGCIFLGGGRSVRSRKRGAPGSSPLLRFTLLDGENEMQVRNVVVGMQQADRCDNPVRLAVKLAESLHATLHVVHAHDLPEILWNGGTRATRSILDHYHEHLERRMARAVELRSPRAPLVFHVGFGPPAERIFEVAQQARDAVIVAGAADPDDLREDFVGSTTRALLRGTQVPLLVTRKVATADVRTILLLAETHPGAPRVHGRALRIVEPILSPAGVTAVSLLVYGEEGAWRNGKMMTRIGEVERSQIERVLQSCAVKHSVLDTILRHGTLREGVFGAEGDFRPDLIVFAHVGAPSQNTELRLLAEDSLRREEGAILLMPGQTMGQTALPVRVSSRAQALAPASLARIAHA
jgi:nucleotide-binding universal stress UspA family protein